jgi:GH25 family lysozyme M1 (1,4-beta-N-acetylmuramidase)
MDTDDAIVLLAAAPATAYREYLYRPGGQLARWIADWFEVVAMPGQRIGQELREGDVLLEVTLGRIGPGRCVTLEAPALELVAMRPSLAPGKLVLRPRKRVEMTEPLPVEPTVDSRDTDLDGRIGEGPPYSQLLATTLPPVPPPTGDYGTADEPSADAERIAGTLEGVDADHEPGGNDTEDRSPVEGDAGFRVPDRTAENWTARAEQFVADQAAQFPAVKTTGGGRGVDARDYVDHVACGHPSEEAPTDGWARGAEMTQVRPPDAVDEGWWQGGERESPFALGRAHDEAAQAPVEAEASGPDAASRRPDGIDVYSGNALPPWSAIKQAGISFIIHKCSERLPNGAVVLDNKPDARSFRLRWEESRASGLIRGSYHYYRHKDRARGSVQADAVAGQVRRLGPGDLAPSLDFENAAVVTGNAEPDTDVWRTELEAFLDTLEVKLGRTPLVYTSGSAWDSHIRRAAASPEFAHFAKYPLWQKSYAGPRFVGGIDLDNAPHPITPVFTEAAANRAESQYRIRQSIRPVPARIAPWQDWTFFQYSPFTPKSLLHNPFELLIDFDTYNGTVYGLRGLADLGRTGVAITAVGAVAAHCEIDQHVHLMREGAAGTWADVDLMDGALPAVGADPVLLGTGAGVVLCFRSDDRVVEAAQPVPGASWDVTDLSGIAGATAWHDPRAILAGGQRFVVFAGQDDDWHLLTRDQAGSWTAAHLLSEARRSGVVPVPPSSGQPALYVTAASPAPRVVGRAGPSGELLELALGARGWEATSLNATVTGPQGPPPAATYSPCIYQTAAETFIVYRAVRGQLWQIARGARRAANISAAAPGSVAAAGHPACFALRDEAHVVYRGVDQGIHELSFRDGTWSARRLPCDGPAASDPACTADGSMALAAFRGMDGMIRVLRFDGSAWTCAHKVRSRLAAGGTTPAEPTGTEAVAVSLAYQHGEHHVDRLTDLVFFGRHPELSGRALRADEKALSSEWLAIRDGVVRPAVAALAQTAAPPQATAQHRRPDAGLREEAPADETPSATVPAGTDEPGESADVFEAEEFARHALYAAVAEEVPGQADAGTQTPGTPGSGARPPVLTATQLRRAWRNDEGAGSRMVPLRFSEGWTTLVNPVTIDAWRALEQALTAAGYRAGQVRGYSDRGICGQATRSLHAYGLAIDIDDGHPACNAYRATPDGRPVRFSSAASQEERCDDVRRRTADTSFTPGQVAAVEAIQTVDGHQVFAWGGRWPTAKATMHFQINVTPAELARGIRPGTAPPTAPVPGAPDSGGPWPAMHEEAAATIERGLEFLAKWGRNASPFKIAHLYLKLNWDGLKYWNDVRKAAAKGHALLDRVDVLERGARVLKKAVDELSAAEAGMPGYPLESADVAGHVMVSQAELEYVRRYYEAASVIQSESMSARIELDQAIAGWDAVVEQANETSDFTRQAAWEAITELDLRFSKEGSGFRAFLVNARDAAVRTEDWAAWKRHTAADILGN